MALDQSRGSKFLPNSPGCLERPRIADSEPEVRRFGEAKTAPPQGDEDSEYVATGEEMNKPRVGSKIPLGEYSPMIYDTPAYGTPASSVSGDESMHNHNENATPPESPKPDSPGAATATKIARLSLENDRPIQNSATSKEHVASPQLPTNAAKRASSSGLPPQKRQPFLLQSPKSSIPSKRGRSNGLKRNHPRRQAHANHQYEQNSQQIRNEATTGEPLARKNFRPVPRDSGYESMTTRTNTLQPAALPGATNIDRHPSDVLPTVGELPGGEDSLKQSPPQDRYPGLIMQPESSPISKDQLAAEVKGIYAGLAMVEAKCINIDAAQANDPNTQLGPEQWQALIALHRTLLYEHHDFLMATQHPSATEALRGLASKYSMPARMWRHGIHAFLEVLRHRRPESQDYMMAFIYLAYQMMALLFETVPTFTDTWIECLGDLARYRMAIEEEREAHAIWGGVAGRWYNTASDRHPDIGRLYHHLGILERPSLRKFFLYAKSLTCVYPFPNARDSLVTLCTPIVQDHGMDTTGVPSAEASIVTFYALVVSRSEDTETSKMASDALSRLPKQSAAKTRDIAVELVISNIAVMLEFGSAQNSLWQLFAKAINENIQKSRPSANTPGPPTANCIDTQDQLLSFASTAAPLHVIDFCYSAFNTLIRLGRDWQSVRDALPGVHTVLVWVHSLFSLQSRTNDDLGKDTFSSLTNPNQFSWGGLSDFLNLVAQFEPVSARTLEFARQGMFLAAERREDARPLSEDYLIRGLIWSQFYFPSDWFDKQANDDGRTIETSSTHKARFERVLWLGLYLAFRVEHLKFDLNTRSFYTPLTGAPTPSKPARTELADVQQEHLTAHSKTPSRSSTAFSADSDSEGYAVVTSSKSKPGRSWANIASKPSKRRSEASDVKIFDEQNIQCEQ